MSFYFNINQTKSDKQFFPLIWYIRKVNIEIENKKYEIKNKG